MTDSDIKIQWHYGVTNADLTSKQYSLHDKSRTVAITGVLLGGISSARDNRSRWTDIKLYRTDGGIFVAYRVGYSSVIHDMSCVTVAGKQLPGPEGLKKTEVPIRDRVACPVCRPQVKRALDEDPMSLRLEVNRYWISIAETAEDLYHDLHTTRHGEQTLSFLAVTLLLNAAQYDPQISAVIEEHKLAVN